MKLFVHKETTGDVLPIGDRSFPEKLLFAPSLMNGRSVEFCNIVNTRHELFTIFVKPPRGRVLSIDNVTRETKISYIKAVIQAIKHVFCDQQRLVYAGSYIHDDGTLEDYNIRRHSTIDLSYGGGDAQAYINFIRENT